MSFLSFSWFVSAVQGRAESEFGAALSAETSGGC